MRGWMHACWAALAVAGAVVAVGLLVWVVAADLERADQIGGVIGALAGVGALGVSLRQLRDGRQGPAPDPAQVSAAEGSIAARGNVRNSRASSASNSTAAPTPSGGISAATGSIASGGDVDGSTAHHGS